MNVADGAAVVRLTDVGVKVPPAAESDGVTTTVPVIAPPSGVTPTLNEVDATPDTPVVGPLMLTAVAAAGKACALTSCEMEYQESTPSLKN